LVDAERKFYQTGQEKGTRAAFLAFLADDGIVFRPSQAFADDQVAPFLVLDDIGGALQSADLAHAGHGRSGLVKVNQVQVWLVRIESVSVYRELHVSLLPALCLGLARNLDIVAIDATGPWGQDHLLPWGRLREPIAGLCRADCVVITRADQ
jgi:hypothetical protein